MVALLELAEGGEELWLERRGPVRDVALLVGSGDLFN